MEKQQNFHNVMAILKNKGLDAAIKYVVKLKVNLTGKERLRLDLMCAGLNYVRSHTGDFLEYNQLILTRGQERYIFDKINDETMFSESLPERLHELVEDISFLCEEVTKKIYREYIDDNSLGLYDD